MSVADSRRGNVSRRRSLLIWGVCCALAGVIFLVYVFAGLAAGRGELVLPLDDVYIHFQYARQFIAGQPYIYNPGQPPSSGATSFLYPYLLAIGYLLGFQGLNLSLWALAIGALSLLGSIWLIYLLSKAYNTPDRIAILTAVIFALTGAVSWHFMSGMETGLVVFFTLLALYFLTPPPVPLPASREGENHRVRGSIMAASLLALIRPEGGIMVLAVTVIFWRMRQTTTPPSPLPIHGEGEKMRIRRRNYSTIWLLMPILAVGMQPLVNLLFTGSLIASGNSAKSLFGIVPPHPDVILSRILNNFARMWAEFATSTSPREGLYVAYPIALLAVVGLVTLLRQRERRLVGLLIVAWTLSGTLAVATLDTAFWHFKRYQMPFMVLLFPLAGWGGAALWGLGTRRHVRNLIAFAVVGLTAVFTLWTGAQFLHHFALNVNYIYLQPLQMARWLEANTPPDTVVAVHDTGLMRYLAGRTTIDMVGLTTPGAAAYWRNGPGAVAEFLIQERPDYIASYGHGHGLGLGMLADTSLYGEPLASFPVELDDRYNVALAADFQGIYRPSWTNTRRTNGVTQFETLVFYLAPSFSPEDLVATVNVGNIASESEHNYGWNNQGLSPGFPTEIREMEYVNCLVGLGDDCFVLDGGRLISSEEAFSVKINPEEDVLLVTRLHPVYRGEFNVYANGALVATRWIPEMPGRWLDVPTLIPANTIAGEALDIRIVPNISEGYYMPYYHWIYQGTYQPRSLLFDAEPVTTFQGGAISLWTGYGVRQFPMLVDGEYRTHTDLTVTFDWYTDRGAVGDYEVFVHLYGDANQPPIAQADRRPGSDSLPPGNWLPGAFFETIVIDLTDLPPGTYQLAVGMYDPVTFERLMPAGGDEQGRFWLGEVEIPAHG